MAEDVGICEINSDGEIIRLEKQFYGQGTILIRTDLPTRVMFRNFPIRFTRRKAFCKFATIKKTLRMSYSTV